MKLSKKKSDAHPKSDLDDLSKRYMEPNRYKSVTPKIFAPKPISLDYLKRNMTIVSWYFFRKNRKCYFYGPEKKKRKEKKQNSNPIFLPAKLDREKPGKSRWKDSSFTLLSGWKYKPTEPWQFFLEYSERFRDTVDNRNFTSMYWDEPCFRFHHRVTIEIATRSIFFFQSKTNCYRSFVFRVRTVREGNWFSKTQTLLACFFFRYCLRRLWRTDEHCRRFSDVRKIIINICLGKIHPWKRTVVVIRQRIFFFFYVDEAISKIKILKQQ